jgi:hypothetical protein
MWDREEVNPPLFEKFLFSKIRLNFKTEGELKNFPGPLFFLLPRET